MSRIGGNLTASIQIQKEKADPNGEIITNSLGEPEMDWVEAQSIKGWLDLSGGNSSYPTYHAKTQESTHFFLADYVTLDSSITPESSRMVINGKRYDILLIDDPMELHQHLEIYLKFTGGQ